MTRDPSSAGCRSLPSGVYTVAKRDHLASGTSKAVSTMLQRLEDPLAQEHVEGHPRRDFDDPAEHVDAEAVVPLGARLAHERRAARASRCSRQSSSSVDRQAVGDAVLAVGVADRRAVQESVGEPGPVRQQIADRDRSPRRHEAGSAPVALARAP